MISIDEERKILLKTYPSYELVERGYESAREKPLLDFHFISFFWSGKCYIYQVKVGILKNHVIAVAVTHHRGNEKNWKRRKCFSSSNS